MSHDTGWVADSRHFQSFSLVNDWEGQEAFQDIVDGKVGSTAYKDPFWLRISRRFCCELSNYLDECVRLASAFIRSDKKIDDNCCLHENLERTGWSMYARHFWRF